MTITNGSEVLYLPQLGLGNYGVSFNASDYDLSSERVHDLRVRDLLGRMCESEIVYKPSLAIPESIQFEKSSALIINSLGKLVEEERTSIAINSPFHNGANNGLHWEVNQTYQVNSVTPAVTCFVVENPITNQVILLDTEGFDNSNDAICDERTGCPLQGADPLCCDYTKVPGLTINRPVWW